nr:hypothetical protein [Yersinia canariae]
MCLKHGVWRPVYFKNKIVERYWRQAVITLLRESYASLKAVCRSLMYSHSVTGSFVP